MSSLLTQIEKIEKIRREDASVSFLLPNNYLALQAYALNRTTSDFGLDIAAPPSTTEYPATTIPTQPTTPKITTSKSVPESKKINSEICANIPTKNLAALTKISEETNENIQILNFNHKRLLTQKIIEECLSKNLGREKFCVNIHEIINSPAVFRTKTLGFGEYNSILSASLNFQNLSLDFVISLGFIFESNVLCASKADTDNSPLSQQESQSVPRVNVYVSQIIAIMFLKSILDVVSDICPHFVISGVSRCCMLKEILKGPYLNSENQLQLKNEKIHYYLIGPTCQWNTQKKITKVPFEDVKFTTKNKPDCLYILQTGESQDKSIYIKELSPYDILLNRYLIQSNKIYRDNLDISNVITSVVISEKFDMNLFEFLRSNSFRKIREESIINDIIQSILFQVLYTLYVLQNDKKHFGKHFRHNDMLLANCFIYCAENFGGSLPEFDLNLEEWNKRKMKLVTHYKIEGESYYLPYVGVLVSVADYDFIWSTKFQNEKVVSVDDINKKTQHYFSLSSIPQHTLPTLIKEKYVYAPCKLQENADELHIFTVYVYDTKEPDNFYSGSHLFNTWNYLITNNELECVLILNENEENTVIKSQNILKESSAWNYDFDKGRAGFFFKFKLTHWDIGKSLHGAEGTCVFNLIKKKGNTFQYIENNIIPLPDSRYDMFYFITNILDGLNGFREGQDTFIEMIKNNFNMFAVYPHKDWLERIDFLGEIDRQNCQVRYSNFTLPRKFCKDNRSGFWYDWVRYVPMKIKQFYGGGRLQPIPIPKSIQANRWLLPFEGIKLEKFIIPYKKELESKDVYLKDSDYNEEEIYAENFKITPQELLSSLYNNYKKKESYSKIINTKPYQIPN